MDISVREKGFYAFGPFLLDPIRRSLTRRGIPVALKPKPFDALCYLVENPGRVVSKDELLSALWPGRVVEEGNISQTIFTLRKALNDGGDTEGFIVTAPGRGYRFTAEVGLESWKPPAAMVDLPQPAPPAQPGRYRRHTVTAAALVVVAVATAVLIWRWSVPSSG
jgi:DNA-binding winged helix-turn-helix (wHTH) protein